MYLGRGKVCCMMQCLCDYRTEWLERNLKLFIEYRKRTRQCIGCAFEAVNCRLQIREEETVLELCL